jgi:hypothetical protein
MTDSRHSTCCNRKNNAERTQEFNNKCLKETMETLWSQVERWKLEQTQNNNEKQKHNIQAAHLLKP